MGTGLFILYIITKINLEESFDVSQVDKVVVSEECFKKGEQYL